MNLDQWLGDQLAALDAALDDALDLDRGLADATLPRAHAGVVAALGDVLDLDAGLAQVLSPPPADRLVAFARDLTELTATERLVVRTWLPEQQLTGARIAARRTLRGRIGTAMRDGGAALEAVLAACAGTSVLVGTDGEPRDLHGRLVIEESRESARFARMLRVSLKLAQSRVPDESTLAERLSDALQEAVDGYRYRTEHNLIALEVALLKALDLMLDAVVDMVGADLASADLTGVPLHRVRWSVSTRWPHDREEWVRDHSVPVSPGVFEIRERGTGSYVLT